MEAARHAIVAVDGTLTYDELDARAARVSGALLAGERDLDQARVAFLVAPSCAYAAVQRGIWRAGGVAVPLAVSHPAAELDYVIRDCGATTVVAGAAFVERLRPLALAAGARLVTVAEAWAAPPNDAPPPHVGAPRRALILYTSGTTGTPKGVVLTHANLGAQVASLVSAWGWTPSDRLLLTLPLHHIHGIVNGLASALAVRATCEIVSPFDATKVWERLASGEITVFTAVPTIYSMLIASWQAAAPEVQQARSAGVRSLRLMMSGSAALPVSVLEQWRAITGHTLLERYGMTETGMIVSNPLVGERRAGFVGTALPGVEVRLVDEQGALSDAAVPGEIEVRGAGVFREYWQRRAETREAFRDGWFRTGDVAVRDRDAYRLLGRTSVDIIKTGGFKVSALEIEETLRAHPAIAECAVVGVSDPVWGERVAAAVVLRAGATLSLGDLCGWVKDRLAPYKVPRALHVLAALPRNVMGKVLKSDVARLCASDEGTAS